ncbi:MAG: hypothetical protein ABL995_08555, partial [Bryobacteraceae bacterium]
SEDSWNDNLWPQLASHASDVVMHSGTIARRGLSVAAAWLLALSAYQKVDGKRPWTEIFDVTNLSVLPNGHSWGNILVTPRLTCNGTFPAHSLHQAIEYYYWMCFRLFRHEAGKAARGEAAPLEKVILNHKEGLCFVLSFDSWSTIPPAPRSLSENVSHWRDAYLRNQPPGGHSWSNKVAAGPNSAARALLDWWLATSVHDFPLEQDSVFGDEEFLRTFLKRHAQGDLVKTYVVFRKE